MRRAAFSVFLLSFSALVLLPVGAATAGAVSGASGSLGAAGVVNAGEVGVTMPNDSLAERQVVRSLPELSALALVGLGLPLLGAVGAFFLFGKDEEAAVNVDARPPLPEAIATFTVTVSPEEGVDGLRDVVLELEDGIDFSGVSVDDVRSHVERGDGTEDDADVVNVLPGPNRLLVTLGDEPELATEDEFVLQIESVPTPPVGEYPVDVELNAGDEGWDLPPETLEIHASEE